MSFKFKINMCVRLLHFIFDVLIVYKPSPYQGSATTPIHDLSTIIYSAKHDGIHIYVARLLRPIWKIRCVDENLNSNLSHVDCTFILEDLFALKLFLDANSVNDISCKY